MRLKVLRRDVTLDRRGLQRFLTATRMVAGHRAHELAGRSLGGASRAIAGAFRSRHLEGETLAARLQRSGPIRLTEAREILHGILGALAALHERRLAHGDLRLENILLVPSFAGEHVVLLDPGSDHLRAPAPIANGQGSRLATLGGDTLAPEQIAGKVADARSDVYAFGALLHQLLSGKPVFASDSPIEALVGHLTREPEPVSDAAPRGWVTSEIDDFVLGLLDKDPSHRPKDAAAVLESLELLGDHVSAPGASLTEEELEQRMTALVTNPWDEEEAAMLESAIDEGVDPGPRRLRLPLGRRAAQPDRGRRLRTRAEAHAVSRGQALRNQRVRIRNPPSASTRGCSRSIPRTTGRRRRSNACGGGSASSTSWSRCCSRAARPRCRAANAPARSPRSASSTTTS